MGIKELKEQRNRLLDEMDNIMDTPEQRDLTKEESKRFNTMLEEIGKIDKQIEEHRNNKGIKVEERKMEDKKLIEQRSALQSYIKNDKADFEKRAQYVNTMSDGSVLIPENVADEILTKMEDASPVFAQARKYPSVKGTLKIARENTGDQAGFVGENEELPSIGLKFSHVTLTQKRVGAAVTLTKQLLNDGGIDLLGYSAGLLSRRTVRAVERSMFKGKGGENGFVGILDEKSGIENEVKLPANITADSLVDITGAINPAYLNDSAFYMSRETFNNVRKLKDNNGDFLLQNGTVNGRLSTTIQGFPVYVTDVLVKEDGIVFGDISSAYGILIKQGFHLNHVNGDTQQTLNGTQLLAFDGYMDGAVINPEALVIAKK